MCLIDGIDGAKEFLDRDFADAGQDITTNARETDFVALVDEKAENRHGVFDFLTVIETNAANDFVGDVHIKESFFKSVGLSVGAIEDGEIGKVRIIFLKV